MEGTDCTYEYEAIGGPGSYGDYWYTYSYDNYHVADIARDYILAGSNTKMYFYSNHHKEGGIVKISWNCLPTGYLSNNDPDVRDPEERLLALQTKALEVIELGGWSSSSSFYNSVSNRLGWIIQKSNSKREKLSTHCSFPAHWDWKEYLVCMQFIINFIY